MDYRAIAAALPPGTDVRLRHVHLEVLRDLGATIKVYGGSKVFEIFESATLTVGAVTFSAVGLPRRGTDADMARCIDNETAADPWAA
jgi:hypothetical protein